MVQTPYLLLAGCLAVALAGWGGYRHGVATEHDRAAASAAETAYAAAHAARLDAEAEAVRRAAEAARNAQAESASREARLRGQLNAARAAPRHGCAMPAERLRDFNAAVSAANAGGAVAERVPDGLPGVARTDDGG